MTDFQAEPPVALAQASGADHGGLICGFMFSPGSPGRPLSLAEAAHWIRQSPPVDPQAFIWLHFNLNDVSSEQWMREHLSLPTEFFDTLRQGSRSTRIDDASDDLIAVVNDVAFEFSFDPSEMATLWATVSERVMISARHHPLRSIDLLRQAARQGCLFGSSVSLLIHLLQHQENVLVDIVRQAATQVDEVEDNLVPDRASRQRLALGTLRRVLVRLQRLLAPEPAALFRLLKQPPPWVRPVDLDELRQSTEEFALVIRDMAALQERIKLLQEELAARVSEQTNQSVFTLTVVTVLALPINIITGMLGMNVGGLPLSDHPHGFLIVFLIVVGITAAAGWLAFRKKSD